MDKIKKGDLVTNTYNGDILKVQSVFKDYSYVRVKEVPKPFKKYGYSHSYTLPTTQLKLLPKEYQ